MRREVELVLHLPAVYNCQFIIIIIIIITNLRINSKLHLEENLKKVFDPTCPCFIVGAGADRLYTYVCACVSSLFHF